MLQVHIKIQSAWSRKGKGKEFRWVRNTLARGPRFGPNVLPIFLPHFPSIVQVLHVVSCRAGLRYGNLGNCQGPPTFGGPQIDDFIFVVLFFCSSTSKNFACGAKIPSIFLGCGADIINNFACGARIRNMPVALQFQKNCKIIAFGAKFPVAIMRLFCSSKKILSYHRFLGAPTNGLPGAPENLNPALVSW
jgi:hypothetical protein